MRFYTRGAARLHTPIDVAVNWASRPTVQDGIIFEAGEAYWRSVFEDIAKKRFNGNATVVKHSEAQPDWDQVRKVIDRKAPVSSLEGCK